MQDPSTYLNEQEIGVPSILDPSRPALIDPSHMTLVNHEIFFFADETEKAAFDRAPEKWMGIITDPVNRTRFRIGDDPPRADFDGRTYFFSSEETRVAFAADPARYANPNYDDLMKPAPEKGG